MDFKLKEEHILVRDMVRDLADRVIAPRAHEVDETSTFPADTFRQLGELGLLGLPYPEKYGGAGGDTVSYAIAVEEISKACGSTGLSYAAHVSLGCAPFYLYGTEAQKQKYLTHLASGKGLGAFGLTEPQGGSDAGSTRTVAVRDGDSWVINGQKMWITSGSVADIIVLTARTMVNGEDKGISCFIVEKGTRGFTPGKDEPKMGLRGSITSQLFFEDCRIPAENVLGEIGKGFRQFLVVLDGGRISIGAMAQGLGEAALHYATGYAKERIAFGHPIAEYQAIQWKLADMATLLSASRLMIMQAAWLKDNKQPFAKEAAMAKLFASEAAEKACFEAIQIYGGYGYSREYPVERLYRDNRLTEIGEGTSEIMRLVIARNILREV